MGLQYSWIEANLLGFFFVDVRNWRGKFDEIKEKFVINPAPIASQSSVYAGGSRWTRDLPRNSLNFFTSRSKVKFEREKYIGLKEEIGLRIVGNGCDRGGGLMTSRGQFRGHRSWLQFRDKSVWVWLQFGFQIATISAMTGPRSCHDRAAIGPRSLFLSFVDRLPIDWRWFLDKRSMIAAWSRRDRGSITARSDRDRGFFQVLSAPSDGVSSSRCSAKSEKQIESEDYES